MENTNNISYSMSTPAILKELGVFIHKIRLQRNQTQQEIAIAAGINRSTLVMMEKGRGGTLQSFIQTLRALEQLHTLNSFIAPEQISPLQLAKLEQQKRKRASSAKNNHNPSQSSW